MLSLSLSRFKARNTRCIVLGITGSWAFAAGVLLLSLKRHAVSGTDILLFHDGSVSAHDKELFENLGCRCIGIPDENILSESVKKTFSSLCLAKFYCFDLLAFYEKILWLDCDVVVQGKLDDIWEYGPFSIAEEDRFFYEDRTARGAGINIWAKLPGIDPGKPNLNSGVIVFSNELLNAEHCHNFCLDYLKQHEKDIRYPDQAVFNMFVQKMAEENSSQFRLLPNTFNSHPLNPDSLYATLVHCFGAYKIWNDGLMLASFPEWQRDYALWKKMGGSCYTGTIDNEEYARCSIFATISKFYGTLTRGEKAVWTLRKELDVERAIRKRLEGIVEKMRKSGE